MPSLHTKSLTIRLIGMIRQASAAVASSDDAIFLRRT